MLEKSKHFLPLIRRPHAYITLMVNNITNCLYLDQMKKKKYYTVGTILKYHTVGTILKYHTVGTILKSSIKIVERGKMDTCNTDIHDL